MSAGSAGDTMAHNTPQRPFINGAFVTGDEPFDVINPATEEPCATVQGASLAQVEAAIAAARRSYAAGEWSQRTTAERAATIHRLVDALAAREEELRRLSLAQTGCPVGPGAAMTIQVAQPLRHARDIPDLFRSLPAIEPNPLPLAEQVRPNGPVQSLREWLPIGVVAAITPYNAPFYCDVWKVLPALMAGNSVVLRPSPLTPLTAAVFGAAAQAAGLPAGVLNVVAEAGSTGSELLTTHPDVDMVAFTGSSQVGTLVMRQAAATMKRLQLELGGKSAQIFLPDALDLAALSPRQSCLVNAGQVCVLPSRVLVPRAAKEAVLAAMRQNLTDIVIGDPASTETQMGPVISAAQRERCERYVQLARDHGARVVHGGRRPAHMPRGYFFEPTLLDVDDPSNPAFREEVFGPVICVTGYDDVEHAVRLANDTVFGLAAYVVGRNAQTAVEVGRRLRAGTVQVNGTLLSAYASSGGVGMSGVGRERGVEGMRIFQAMRCLNIVPAA